MLGQRHYDVQLMGGAALHFGWIAEMKTGEGKTLVSTLPAYLNGLGGKGVHLITVNDYLARRDSEWMGRLHRWLGPRGRPHRPGRQRPRPQARRSTPPTSPTAPTTSSASTTSATTWPCRRERQMQRGHSYAIVDEVDSILIDEARTPLIISGRVADAAQLYYKFATIVRSLRRDDDYEVDEEKRTVSPTEDGIEKVEQALGVENLYDGVAQNLVHQLQAALRAKELFKRDKDYIVANGEVKIVDEFTGRILEGRRWSEGLHQAVEAKEGVKIKEENQTLATITLQNYFRMYDKLAGMTGTAATEAAEFANTYDLQVVPIPTNQPTARADQGDLIYKTEDGKFDAVVDDIAERYEAGQPVLVGTISVEKSEKLSRLLEKRGIAHEVLNAKQHTREAEIVAQAGRLQGVTVATNMAGRGVDILLGGNPEGLAARDLRAEGLDLESDEGHAQLARARGQVRRGDQGRGRQGPRARRPLRARHRAPRVPPHRQPAPRPLRPPGRPGREPLLPVARGRPHAPVRHRRHQLGDGQGPARRRADRGEDGHQGHRAGPDHRRAAERRDPQERPQVRRGHERAAQGHLRAARPDPRRGRPAREDPHRAPPRGGRGPRRHLLRGRLPRGVGPRRAPRRGPHLLARRRSPSSSSAAVHSTDELYELLVDDATTHYEKRESELGADVMRQVERQVMLRIIDTKWREHLYEMDYLQEGINLRAMGQKDPLIEWQREGFEMFGQMMKGIAQDFVRYVMHVQVTVQQPTAAPAVGTDFGDGGGNGADRPRSAATSRAVQNVQYSAPDDSAPGGGMAAAARQVAAEGGPAAAPAAVGRPARHHDAGREVRVGQDAPQRARAPAGAARSSSSATARPEGGRCATSPTRSS